MMTKVFVVQELYVNEADVENGIDEDGVDEINTRIFKKLEDAQVHLETLLNDYISYIRTEYEPNLDEVEIKDKLEITFDKEEGYLMCYYEDGKRYVEAFFNEAECEFVDRTTKDK